MIKSFPPLARPDARILIMGSMPGAASLRAGRYYAHPRNSFWPMIDAILGRPVAVAATERLDEEAVYARRVALLLANRLALWDVLQSCRRRGSLDAAIDRQSRVANDFAAFYADHQQIELLCFNGATAESLYRSLVQPRLPAGMAGVACLRLPSTSPAHAALSYDQKLQQWSRVLSPGRR